MAKRRITIEWDEDSPKFYAEFANTLWWICQISLRGGFRVINDKHVTAQELNAEHDETGRTVRWT